MYFRITTAVMAAACFLIGIPLLASAHPTLSGTPTTRGNSLGLRDDNNPGDIVGLEVDWPDCSNIDPSYADPQSSYNPQEGAQIGYPVCAWSAHQEYCWTSYYIVDYQINIDHWKQLPESIDCNKTSACWGSKGSSDRVCTDWHFNVGGSVNVELQGKITKFITRLFQQVEVEVGASAGKTWGEQTCHFPTSNDQCIWDDKLCHSQWSADKTLVLTGYMRRFCDHSRPNTKIPQQQQIKGTDNNWTVGKQDFTVNVGAIGRVFGCAGLCSDLTYPGTDISGTGVKVPVPTDADFQR